MYILVFLFGLASSIHCVGMCGPINLILPLSKTDRVRMIQEFVVYHLGRILVYIVLGFLISQVGSLLEFTRWQSYLSFTFGFLIFAYGINYFIKLTSLFQTSWFQRTQVIKLVNRLLQKSSFQHLFLLGALNGIIPCGMVYAAMAMAFFGHSGMQGAVMMFLFGLGTLPALFILILGMKNTWIKSISKTYKVQPTLMIISGVLICLKSMNTIIPAEMTLWHSILNPILCH